MKSLTQRGAAGPTHTHTPALVGGWGGAGGRHGNPPGPLGGAPWRRCVRKLYE